MNDFERALTFCLKWEGGDKITDDPNDPGGLTKFGVSQRAYPNEDIRKLTRARAAFLYRRDYWDKGRCQDFPSPIGIVHFDCAVNTGIVRANKILQKACGVTDDGVIGKATITAIAGKNALVLAEDAIHGRELFYRSLANQSPAMVRYLVGWLNRCADLRKTIEDSG